MTDHGPGTTGKPDTAARAAFLDAELVPEAGGDDLPDPADRTGETGAAAAADAWLTREVPPHHGG